MNTTNKKHIQNQADTIISDLQEVILSTSEFFDYAKKRALIEVRNDFMTRNGYSEITNKVKNWNEEELSVAYNYIVNKLKNSSKKHILMFIDDKYTALKISSMESLNSLVNNKSEKSELKEKQRILKDLLFTFSLQQLIDEDKLNFE